MQRVQVTNKERMNNKGMYSVEVSIILPIVIICIMLIIYAFVIIINREKVRSDMHSGIMNTVTDDSGYNKDVLFGHASVDMTSGEDYISATGEIDMTYLGRESLWKLKCIRDSDNECTKRLRNFQLIKEMKE